MRLTIGGADVTSLAPQVSTSGNSKECARTLKASIVQSPTDPNIRTVAVRNGMTVSFSADGQNFYGTIYDISRSTDSAKVDFTAKDNGVRATQNQITYKAKKMTPETAAVEICALGGVPGGSFAGTGYEFSRNYVGVSVYDAIMTGYSLAAAENGKKYILGYDGASMYVRERGGRVAAVIYEGYNLIAANYSESISGLVSAVEIYDSDGKLIDTVTGNSGFGTFKRQITEGGNEDAVAKAQEMIRDNGVTRTGSVQNIGSAACITGAAVMIRESFTGLYGLFYIDGDTHTWKNGLYTNKLTLGWTNTMDSKAAGEYIKMRT